MTLLEHMNARLVDTLAAIPVDDRADIYVVSLFVYDAEDDPRCPTITVGYNSEDRVAACTPAPRQDAKWPIASDADEARWNYAFWLQNALDVICDDERDPEGARLVQAWAKDRGYWYSDEEEDRDIEAAQRKVEPLTGEFIQLAADMVKRLHATGEIARLLGRPLPILIHELEYYEEIAAQNEGANPAVLVADFSRWVRSL